MYFSSIGALFLLVGVAAGAFGAHGLRERLSPEMLAVFETGARYQLLHGLGLILVGQRAAGVPGDGGLSAQSRGGWLLVAGTVVFSGSLYVLALTGVRAWGAVTPVGGVCFLAGWGLLARAWWPRR
ncbi:MAG: DUF423 domain-containing protein [Candidatus Eisenbacteria bacterium]|uniref:DUF423 domain-containing protein n=1 Tax=Eiseniibacteriota bacterium TaxID=2212470 RepID=A0A933W990_UNCEI|nr:DUF423 domain-containing protein [Candidatus Eisenbacteria bacterium]